MPMMKLNLLDPMRDEQVIIKIRTTITTNGNKSYTDVIFSLKIPYCTMLTILAMMLDDTMR
jgi:hypothetical protein